MSGMDCFQKAIGDFAAEHQGLTLNCRRMKRSGPCDVELSLDKASGSYGGLRILLLEDVREPSPEEWAQLREMQGKGLFACVCFDISHALDAALNYLRLGADQRFAQGVAVFKGGGPR